MKTDHLIRRIGGIEVPTPGRWTIPRTHVTVRYSARTGFARRVSGRAPAATGVLDVADDPSQSTLVLYVAAWRNTQTPAVPSLGELLGSEHVHGITLRGSSMDLHADGGWRLRGLADVSWISSAAVIGVGYHGVYRTGDGGKAWLTVRADIDHDVDGLRRKGPVSIVADVLAVAPTRADPCGPVDAGRAA
jgi:hypothetical protein